MLKIKKVFFGFFITIAAILVLMVLVKGLSKEDDWLCVDGQWVKHGQPSAPQPTEPCGEVKQDIIISLPQPNQTISSPLKIEGQAVGNWFFEAVLPVKLIDETGAELAAGYVQATTDWMTEDLVPFQGELDFLTKTSGRGFLVLSKDNPSGLPENDKDFLVPVQWLAMETMKVKAYFNNNELDPAVSCNKVFEVEREVAKTQEVARAALTELLKGPTEIEKTDGYFTNINTGVKIQQLTIVDGVAKVDFGPQMDYQMGGSCRVAAIRSQITQTLKQFSTVKEVIISIDGRTEDILQP